MKKRYLCRILAIVVILCVLLFEYPTVNAATALKYSPYASVEYDYSSSVACGEIRYISQLSGRQYFYSDYWGSWEKYAGSECGTASISMSLSYIGVDKTPEDILDYGSGTTYFGENWGGATAKSYSYSNFTTAFNNYLNGNGKYSPPVIHLNKYSSAGHFVVVVGQVSANVYQIIDPANASVWNMTISSSNATYTKNGSTINDSIDRSGRSDDIYQWYNADASISVGAKDYAGKCDFYSSHCKIKITESKTYLMTQPCSSGTDSSSKMVETASKNDTYEAIGLYLNTAGNLWYQVKAKSTGETAYVPSSRTSFVEHIVSDVTISGVSAPTSLQKGKTFSIRGNIKSNYNDLTEVSAYVYSGSATSGSAATGKAVSVNGKSYSLYNSTVDAGVLFNYLGTGTYTYVVRANAKSYYAKTEKELASKSTSVLLHSSSFSVYSGSAPKTYTVTFDANGGSCSTSSKTVVSGGAVGSLPTATRAGYDFAGWYSTNYTYDSYATEIVESTVVTQNVTFYAFWANQNLSGQRISFDANGGVLKTDAIASHAISAFNAPRRESETIVYNCDGIASNTNYYGFEVAVDATGKVIEHRGYADETNLTVPKNGFVLSSHNGTEDNGWFVRDISIGNYVAYDKDAMRVYVYDSQDAYLANHKYVKSGETYGALPTPTNGNKKFLGWYTAPSGGKKVTSSTTYTASTLYAVWEEPGGTAAGDQNGKQQYGWVKVSYPLYEEWYYYPSPGEKPRSLVFPVYVDGSIPREEMQVVINLHNFDFDKLTVTIPVTNPKNEHVVYNVLYDFTQYEILPNTVNFDEGVRITVDYGCRLIVSDIRNDSVEMAQKSFVDVTPDKYYFDAVQWAVDYNITSGKDATHFDPTGACTRAQVVTFLWRAAGEPEPARFSGGFPDVPSGKYYSRAVLWAVEQGITNGFKDGTFGPDKTCTRGQIVTFLWRYLGMPPAGNGYKIFIDVDLDEYYSTAVAWALENDVTTGYKDGTFKPDKTCTRDQIVTFLCRALALELDWR